MIDPRTVTKPGAIIIQGNALALPIPDESVDLIITSPPYFALRSYRDGDEHYEGQIGSEPTPAEFLEALWAATAEMVRVLKPTGSIWVNLGDKYAGSGGHNNSGLGGGAYDLPMDAVAVPRDAPKRYNQSSVVTPSADNWSKSTLKLGKHGTIAGAKRISYNSGIQAKSLMGLPWRYAIGCIDQLGLILRAEVIWSKPNGLPESVTDRVRRSHEQWFMFVRQGKYFAAVDEVREAQVDPLRSNGLERMGRHGAVDGETPDWGYAGRSYNPLGKLPGSVWTIPSEPLIIPDAVKEHYDLPDHFAAFPQEWPRRIILGWSPSGICTACGEGRRPVVEKEKIVTQRTATTDRPTGLPHDERTDYSNSDRKRELATITGYKCECAQLAKVLKECHCLGTFGTCPACDPDFTWNVPPTTPAIVLDPFAGTGTVPMVARALGRIGIGVELSHDYCRLANWRVFESGHAGKTEARTNLEAQGGLF